MVGGLDAGILAGPAVGLASLVLGIDLEADPEEPLSANHMRDRCRWALAQLDAAIEIARGDTKSEDARVAIHGRIVIARLRTAREWVSAIHNRCTLLPLAKVQIVHV